MSDYPDALSVAQLRQIVVDNTGECRCDPAYSERRLRDPQCDWHQSGEGIVEDYERMLHGR